MADKMMNCPACVKEISVNAKVCPHCGEPIKPKSKVSGLVWLALGAVIIAAIAVPKNGSETTAAPKSSIIVKKATVYACDNLKNPSTTKDSTPCFKKSDPQYMTIGLYAKPGRGVAVRVKDDGNGVKVTTLKKEFEKFSKVDWYYVKTQNKKEGWITENNIIFSK